MIFQIPLSLNIKNKNVQAVIDLETGIIGFTESINNETIEYYYNESPFEYKKALLEKLEPSVAEKSLLNFKISKKNKNIQKIQEILKNQKEQ